MNKREIFKAGYVQFDVINGENHKNQLSVQNGIEKLAKEGCLLAVLPEMWSCGFDNSNLEYHSSNTPPVIKELRSLALKHGMVISGTLPEQSGGKVYNTHYIIDADGTVSGAYRKTHLFTLTGEDKYFASGRDAVVCETSVGKIGLMTCYDLRFPELARNLTLMGAEIIVVSAQWPDVRIAHWDNLLKARAIENQLFVIASNRCGKSGNLSFNGHSQVISPWGELLAESPGDFPEEKCVQIDISEIYKVRKTIPCLYERNISAYAVENP